jgi:hypothetical protein
MSVLRQAPCECCLCSALAVKQATWVNDSVCGVGGGLQGGPMCENCLEFMWDALSRFPVARETWTIWPLSAVLQIRAMA